jgi:hypothetical protein
MLRDTRNHYRDPRIGLIQNVVHQTFSEAAGVVSVARFERPRFYYNDLSKLA